MTPRTFFCALWVAACILLGIGGGMIATSCSTTAQRNTVNTLYSTGKTADAAFKSYLDLVVSKQLPTNDVPKVAKLYADFQTAYAAAVSLAAFNTNAPPSPEVANASSQLLLSITAAKKGKP